MDEATTAAPLPPLERSYRRVLRLLPREHRERWADDMVATLLETEQQSAAGAVAAEGPQRQAEEREIALLGRPPAREVAAVALLAVRLHLAAPTTPGASETGRRWGEAVRRLALVLLAGAAASSALEVLSALFWPVPDDLTGQVSRADLWSRAAPGLLWVAAFVLLVRGRVPTARVVAVVVAVLQVWASLSWVVTGWPWGPGSLVGHAVGTVLLLLPVLALVAWRTEAPRPDRRWLWAPLVVAAVQAGAFLPLLLVPQLATQATGTALWLLGDVAGGTCLAAAAVAAVAAVRKDPSWWRTALLLAVAAGLGRLAVVPGTHLAEEQLAVAVAVGGAQLLVAVAVVAAAVVVLRGPRSCPRP